MSSYSGGSYQAQPSSTMSLISLVSGILGLTLIPIVGSIVALITGYMAKQEIRDSSGVLGGDGQATVGIVLGWIGVGFTILGCCVVGVVFLFPACLIPLGITLDQYGSILPLILSVI